MNHYIKTYYSKLKLWGTVFDLKKYLVVIIITQFSFSYKL